MDARANDQDDEYPPERPNYQSREQPAAQCWPPPPGNHAKEHPKHPAQDQHQQKANELSRSLAIQGEFTSVPVWVSRVRRRERYGVWSDLVQAGFPASP